mmetsp:Transcript_61036/g.138049  ORF Transcript_61036/g.138049 Transcript_61036/m.138049 type:complete len:243 (+) Transcript_61036:3551-4279(+)
MLPRTRRQVCNPPDARCGGGGGSRGGVGVDPCVGGDGRHEQGRGPGGRPGRPHRAPQLAAPYQQGTPKLGPCGGAPAAPETGRGARALAPAHGAPARLLLPALRPARPRRRLALLQLPPLLLLALEWRRLFGLVQGGCDVRGPAAAGLRPGHGRRRGARGRGHLGPGRGPRRREAGTRRQAERRQAASGRCGGDGRRRGGVWHDGGPAQAVPPSPEQDSRPKQRGPFFFQWGFTGVDGRAGE